MAWDRTKPVTNAALESAPVRANFQAIDEAIGGINLFADPNFLIWPAGDAAAPAGTAISGTGASIARDTTNFKSGGMAPELTMGTATSRHTRTLMATLDPALRGIPFGIGAYVRTATAGLAKLEIDDGINQSVSVDFHTGGNSFEWMTAVRTLDSSATKLDVSLLLDIAASSGDAIWDMVTFLLGPIPPAVYKACPHQEGALYVPKPGGVSVATNIFRFLGKNPFLVTDVSMRVETAPTGAALIADVNHWDSAVYQSMFSTLPQIAIAANKGGAAPDGTYRYRCFDGSTGTDSDTDTLLNADIDQVGSTIAGSDLEIYIHTLQYQEMLADLRL